MGYTLWRRVYPNDIYVDWKFIRPGFYRLGFAIECLGNLLTSRGR